MRNILEKIVWTLFFILAFLCLLCGGFIVNRGDAEPLSASEGLLPPAQERVISASQEEAAPDITVDDLCQIVSPIILKSSLPVDLYECTCIRIDLDTKVIPMGSVIEGEFFFSELPPTLDLVFLYDGYHLVPAHWHWTDENRIYVAFDVEDIVKLAGTVGLYIFLFAYQGM